MQVRQQQGAEHNADTRQNSLPRIAYEKLLLENSVQLKVLLAMLNAYAQQNGRCRCAIW